MIEVLRPIMDYLIANYALYLVVTMGVIISLTIGLLTLIKKPIKKLTSKIPNEKVSKLANKMFIFFAFGISASAWAILNLISPSYFPLEALQILLTGAFSIVLYAFGDGIITKGTAQNLVEATKDFVEEEKSAEETKDKDAIKAFWKDMKKK